MALCGAFLLASACGCEESQCIEERHAFSSMAAMSPGKISGFDFLARGAGVHQVAIGDELGASRNDVLTTPIAGMTTATVEIRQEAADYSFVSSHIESCTGPGCNSLGLLCLDRLELSVSVRLQSADGRFNERWTGILTGPEPSDPQLTGQSLRRKSEQVAWIRIKLDPSTFRGSFRVFEVRPPADHELQEHDLQLELQFRGGRLVEGQVVSELLVSSGNAQLRLRERELWIRPMVG